MSQLRGEPSRKRHRQSTSDYEQQSTATVSAPWMKQKTIKQASIESMTDDALIALATKEISEKVREEGAMELIGARTQVQRWLQGRHDPGFQKWLQGRHDPDEALSSQCSLHKVPERSTTDCDKPTPSDIEEKSTEQKSTEQKSTEQKSAPLSPAPEFIPIGNPVTHKKCARCIGCKYRCDGKYPCTRCEADKVPCELIECQNAPCHFGSNCFCVHLDDYENIRELVREKPKMWYHPLDRDHPKRRPYAGEGLPYNHFNNIFGRRGYQPPLWMTSKWFTQE